MNNHNDKPQAFARRNYTNALRQAHLRKAISAVIHQCNDLVPTHVILGQLDLNKRADRGIQRVPLHQIVGSTGRYADFDLKFMPRHQGSEARWTNIASALYQGRHLPPILLYQVGQAYFVQDGNHRVSVARAAGKEWIQAHVIEFDSTTLVPKPTCQRLGFSLAGANDSSI